MDNYTIQSKNLGSFLCRLVLFLLLPSIQARASSGIHKIDCDWNLFQVLNSASPQIPNENPKLGYVLKYGFRDVIQVHFGEDLNPEMFARFIVSRFGLRKREPDGTAAGVRLRNESHKKKNTLEFELGGKAFDLRFSVYKTSEDDGTEVVIFQNIKPHKERYSDSGEPIVTFSDLDLRELPPTKVHPGIFEGLDPRWRISRDFYTGQVESPLKNNPEFELFGRITKIGPTLCSGDTMPNCYCYIRTEDPVKGLSADILVLGNSLGERAIKPVRVVFQKEADFQKLKYHYFRALGKLIFSQLKIPLEGYRFKHLLFGRVREFLITPDVLAKNVILQGVSLSDLIKLLKNSFVGTHDSDLNTGRVVFGLGKEQLVYSIFIDLPDGPEGLLVIKSAQRVNSNRLTVALVRQMFEDF